MVKTATRAVPRPLLTVAALAAMTQAERDKVFAAAPAGDVPTGRGAGTVVFGSGGPLAAAAARAIRLAAWKGKVFAPGGRELRNLVSPLAVPAIKAAVYPGASLLDQDPCTVLDYSKTSIVAWFIRDEIREVGPHTYLGVVWIGGAKIVNFTLEFDP